MSEGTVKWIRGGTVLTADGTFRELDIRTENGRIVQLAERGEAKDADSFDAAGRYVIPGLFDIHTHGCAGYDVSDGDPSALGAMAEYYAKNGITSFLATTMSLPALGMSRTLTAVRDYTQRGEKRPGATLRGINLEGPFFNCKKRGAHVEEYLANPNYAALEQYDKLSGGLIKIVCVAPELPGGMEFIRRASERYVVSAAHTDAGYDTMMEAIDAGVSQVTHLFNAMSPFHHREPGVPGAVFDSKIRAEVVCDGIHLHPAVLRTVFRMLGERAVIISDSMRACGLPDGTYDLGGQTVAVRSGKATLSDGTIAGSATNIMEAVRRLVSFGIPLETALCAATKSPAEAVGLGESIGALRPGLEADIVVLSRDLEVEAVFIGGNESPRSEL